MNRSILSIEHIGSVLSKAPLLTSPSKVVVFPSNSNRNLSNLTSLRPVSALLLSSQQVNLLSSHIVVGSTLLTVPKCVLMKQCPIDLLFHWHFIQSRYCPIDTMFTRLLFAWPWTKWSLAWPATDNFMMIAAFMNLHRLTFLINRLID